MPDQVGENLLRMMADRGLSIQEVVDATGLDERTIRGILGGTTKPHARSLSRLAEGLGVAVDEFFLDPTRLLYRSFDRLSNPIVEEVLRAHGELFTDWTEADFDELHSRVGAGGGLTRQGAIAAVRQMNHKRELHEKLDLLLESTQAEVVSGMVELLYARIVAERQ